MNAQQRRTAYRNIKRMVGMNVYATRSTGVVQLVGVVGLTWPVEELGSTSMLSTFDGSRPSVHRALVRSPLGSVLALRLKALSVTAPTSF